MVRGDLADVELADRVFAPHYARAMPRIAILSATIRDKPGPDGSVVGMIAHGDAIDLFDISGGWAWVRCSAGLGYIPADALSAE